MNNPRFTGLVAATDIPHKSGISRWQQEGHKETTVNIRNT